jgi:hypothetical protein
MGKRTAINPETRRRVIEDLTSGNFLQNEIAIRNKVSRAAVSLISKSLTTPPTDRKRSRPESVLGLSEVLKEWFLRARAAQVPISGNLLQVKAIEIARSLGSDSFKGSNGWLQKWTKWAGLTSKMIHGEAISANLETISEWQNSTLVEILQKFPLDCIFNADETGLFYKEISKRTYEKRNAVVRGCKKSKLRVSVLLCCNYCKYL